MESKFRENVAVQISTFCLDRIILNYMELTISREFLLL